MDILDSSISSNLKRIQEKIQASSVKRRGGQKPVTLVAVTKNIGVEDIREAVQSGVKHLGESKIQEAKEKYKYLGPIATWHLVGHLQTNKSRPAAGLFDWIQSLDALRTAEALSRHVQSLERTLDVLVEVNITEEPKKYGVPPGEALSLIREIARRPGLRLRGLMAMAPWVEDAELTRPFFRRTADLFLEAGSLPEVGERWDVLSMGMTNDFPVAVEEGSTMVRIGTGIFRTGRRAQRS